MIPGSKVGPAKRSKHSMPASGAEGSESEMDTSDEDEEEKYSDRMALLLCDYIDDSCCRHIYQLCLEYQDHPE